MTASLSGKRVVNTRALSQAAELDALLRAKEAIPVSYPCIEVRAVDDTRALDDAIRQLVNGAFDWWIVSSINTVMVVADRLATLNLRVPASPPFRTAVVGPGTAEALQRYLGLRADVIPATYRRDSLAVTVPINRGDRALILQSEIAPPTLPDALTDRGAIVTTAVAYRTVAGQGGVNLSHLLVTREVDAALFASSSAVDGCAARLAAEGGHMELLNAIPVICMGPGTAQTARAHGLVEPVIPAEQTLEGLMATLETAFATTREGSTS